MDTPRHVRVGEEEATNFNLFKNLCYSPLGQSQLRSGSDETQQAVARYHAQQTPIFDYWNLIDVFSSHHLHDVEEVLIRLHLLRFLERCHSMSYRNGRP